MKWLVHVHRMLLVVFGFVMTCDVARGQEPQTDFNATASSSQDSLQYRQLVQLSPKALVFTPQTTVGTLEFHNESDSVKQAQVQVQFAYTDEARGLSADTIVIDPKPAGAGNVTDVHDTVILNPGPKEPYAGRWLSGVPTTVTLAPRQTKRIMIRLTPPANLPPGEYWARIVTLVRPNDSRKPGGQDVHQRYALPIKGNAPLLRDTCAIIYRKGPLRMGLAIDSGGVARIDAADVGGAGQTNFSHALWVRLPLRLTGNVPFRGMLHSWFHSLTTGEDVRPVSLEVVRSKSRIDHFVVETDQLAVGSWEYTLWFDNERTDIPPAERIPMTPVRHTFRFEVVPAWQR